MDNLTDEKALLYNIAIYLPPKDIITLCSFGKKYDICDDTLFWKDKFYYDYGHLHKAENWKGIYERIYNIYNSYNFKHMSNLSIIEFIKKITIVQIKHEDTYIPQIIYELKNYIEKNGPMITKKALVGFIDYCIDIIDPHTSEDQHKNDILQGKIIKLPDEFKYDPSFMSLFLN